MLKISGGTVYDPANGIDGELRDLDKSLTEAMKTYAPLTIINDHLLGGMKAVGELFGSGQMQLPFVLRVAALAFQFHEIHGSADAVLAAHFVNGMNALGVK